MADEKKEGKEDKKEGNGAKSSKAQPKILIYSTPTCPYCHKAKEYLKGKGYKYTDIDVAANHDKAKEMVEKSGQMGVPVLDIGGQIIVGFDQEKIDEALKKDSGKKEEKKAA